MRDWEKGSRNLADLAESEPGHRLGLGAHSSEPVSMSEPLMPAWPGSWARRMVCPA